MPTNAEQRKRLVRLLPEGVVTVPTWLMRNGFERHTIDNLLKSGSLTALHHGVYVRGSAPLPWQAIVYSLQRLLNTGLVVGGLTALELQGLAHHLPLSGNKTVHLYGKEKLPTWVNSLLPDVTFIWHPEKVLTGRKNTRKQKTGTAHKTLNSFVIEKEWREGFDGLILSTPERAYLEVLAEVPEKVSFEHADQLMQGMTSLTPRSLQSLLELSGNVKVKRLFFWFAERHNYTWLAKLDKASINLGKGNRMLVRGGKLDKKYQISVPESL